MIDHLFLELEPMNLLSVRKEGEYMTSCADAWQSMINFIVEKNIVHKIEKRIVMGYSSLHAVESEDRVCEVCILLEDDSVAAEGVVQNREVMGGHYAMFLHKGAYTELKASYLQIRDWMHNNNIAYKDALTFERHIDVDESSQSEESLRTEIYIPLV